MSRIVRKTLAECRITPKRKQALAELARRPDSEIDFSDIPELTQKFWQNAIPNPYYRPVKKQITLRIDADILAWLRRKSQGGYQSRLNSLLRHAMLQDLAAKQKHS